MATNEFMLGLGLPISDVNPDGKADKSQRCMLLSCPGRRAILIQRQQEAAIRDSAMSAARAAAQDARERKALMRKTQKTGNGRRKAITQTVMKAIRAASKSAPCKDAQDKCETCDSKWSVFETYSDEHDLAFHPCKVTGLYVCCFCCPKPESVKAHEVCCRQIKALQEQMALAHVAVAQASEEGDEEGGSEQEEPEGVEEEE